METLPFVRTHGVTLILSIGHLMAVIIYIISCTTPWSRLSRPVRGVWLMIIVGVWKLHEDEMNLMLMGRSVFIPVSRNIWYKYLKFHSTYSLYARITNTETEMPCRRNFRHWLHRNLSKEQRCYHWQKSSKWLLFPMDKLRISMCLKSTEMFHICDALKNTW